MSQPGNPWPTPPSRVPPAAGPVGPPPAPFPTEGGYADPSAFPGPGGSVPPPGGKAKAKGVRNLVEWFVIIGGALVVAFLVKTFLIQAFYIPSGSMLPTLEIQDRVLVNKLSYDLHPVHRGDIIVFKSPDQTPGQVKDLIKRVIGIPGDTVEAHDGKLFVNGVAQNEPFLGPGVTTGPLEPQKIPPGHYWVMGDNRGNSKDSRFFGAIPKSLIIGRAFVRVWPIGRFHFF